jgi:hypothetical protein
MTGNEYPCSHGDPCECGYERLHALAEQRYEEENPHLKRCFWCGEYFDPMDTGDAWETCSLKCNMEWMASEAEEHFHGDKDIPYLYDVGDSTDVEFDKCDGCDQERWLIKGYSGCGTHVISLCPGCTGQDIPF